MQTYSFEKHMKVTRRDGPQIHGHSPFREDKNPSFSANVETGLWKDFGTGEAGNWVQFCERIGIESENNKKPDDFWKNAKKIKDYYYQDDDGKDKLRVERWENPSLGKKQFPQYHIQNGRWIKGKSQEDVAPYLYSKWKNATQPIFHVEGEKCVEFLGDHGLIATTTPGGSTVMKLEHIAKYYQDRVVYIFPDNDSTGRSYAERIASIISPVCKELKVIELGGLNEGDDVVQWLEKFGTVDDLKKLCEASPKFIKAEGWPHSSKADDFGPLRNLPSLLPLVPSLEPWQIPESIRAWAMDTSERMTISPEFLVIPAFVGLASIIGRRLAVRPKKFDPWWEIPNLWGMIVGAPSVLKSPALNEALGFLSSLNKIRIDKFKREQQDAAPKIGLLKIKAKAVEAALKSALKKHQDTADFESQLKLIQEEAAKLMPKLSRLMVNDTTVEKLCELLAENPNGLLLFRDELSGWMFNLTKQGREGDRELYLESWNGKNPYNVERIQRGSQFIPAVRIAIVGGIQPAKLNSMMKDIVNGGSGADGLFDRFQLAVFPERKEWKFIDRLENREAKERVFKIFEFLLEADFSSQGLESIDGIPCLRFAPDAQALFNCWLEKLEAKLRHPSITDAPYFESHLGKYRSLMPKLSALIETIEWADKQRLRSDGIKLPLVTISSDSAEMAITLCDFLEIHAKKIHALASEPGIIEALELSKKIKTGEIKHGDTLRSISRHHWHRLRKIEDLEAGISVLEKYNHVRLENPKAGKPGRPSEVLVLHPDLRK